MYRLYTKPEQGHNRVTVVGEHKDGLLKIAVARCGKKDVFIKKRGRIIAENRLTKDLLFNVYPMTECTSKDFVNIATNVAEEVLRTKEVVSEKFKKVKEDKE
jgi:hypothetical protein